MIFYLFFVIFISLSFLSNMLQDVLTFIFHTFDCIYDLGHIFNFPPPFFFCLWILLFKRSYCLISQGLFFKNLTLSLTTKAKLVTFSRGPCKTSCYLTIFHLRTPVPLSLLCSLLFIYIAFLSVPHVPTWVLCICHFLSPQKSTWLAPSCLVGLHLNISFSEKLCKVK